jgi:hypothetical protein
MHTLSAICYIICLVTLTNRLLSVESKYLVLLRAQSPQTVVKSTFSIASLVMLSHDQNGSLRTSVTKFSSQFAIRTFLHFKSRKLVGESCDGTTLYQPIDDRHSVHKEHGYDYELYLVHMRKHNSQM